MSVHTVPRPCPVPGAHAPIPALCMAIFALTVAMRSRASEEILGNRAAHRAQRFGDPPGRPDSQTRPSFVTASIAAFGPALRTQVRGS